MDVINNRSITISPGTLSKLIIVCFLQLLSFTRSSAQVELSNSIEFGCPFLINSNNDKLFYSQYTAGLRFGISYKPTGTEFFPTLNYSLGITKFPLQQFGENVAAIDFNYGTLMLYGNFVFALNNGNSLYFLGGIGFNRLVHKGLDISGLNSGTMSIQADSSKNINTYFPAMGLGVEYVYGDAVNRNIYISMGFMLLYTYLYPDRNTYAATVTENTGNNIYINSSLVGHPVTPSINMTLHVLLGRYMIFWSKDKNN